MYIPEHFAENDNKSLLDFLRRHPFGQLLSRVNGRLFSTHLPMLVSDHGTHLLGHVAYQNPQWDGLEDQEVLVTFQGEHAYVSPSLYHSHGVPTWNYQAVHVYGRATVFHDDEKRALLESLTREHERHRHIPWLVNLSQDMLKSLVGIEIEISELQGKYKLSQNRSADDRSQVASDLEQQGFGELARSIRDHLGDES